MIGETIKEFKLTAPLGKGGMGEVWAAEQQIVKTKVAIKLLGADISQDTQHVQRFFNEAIAVSKIKHAGIVRIFDVGFHDQRAYLIMELLDGETLASRIARAGRLPLGQIADVGKQIASILAATHATGITHRDLKPDNIFLVPDAELASRERVKVLDFGIAKLGTGQTGMTAVGGSMGTPGYMAPEQWSDAATADSRADLYALGCVVFEMACGRPPFVATSIAEACTAHLTVTPPRLRTLAPELPADLDELVARMLAKAPAARPTIAEIAALFAELTTRAPGALAETLLPTAAPRVRAPDTTLGAAAASAARTVDNPAPVRRTGLYAGLAVAVLAAGSAALFATTRHHEDAVVARPPPPPPRVDVPVAAPVAAAANPWVAIDPPASPVALGVADDRAADDVHGFRPARKIVSPAAPYAIQQHEVTWSELDPWLAAHAGRVDYPAWATDPAARAQLPASGITWTTALAYCQSIGGVLPSEEQWEYAARGATRRPEPWGGELLDRQLTHAYAGPDAIPVAVASSAQDQTPPIGGLPIYDLAGNVQEWTMGLWREDRPGADESWVEAGQTSVRAIRGFPLAAVAPAELPVEGAAYRERLCATGPCVEKGRKLRMYVGFRCARAR